MSEWGKNESQSQSGERTNPCGLSEEGCWWARTGTGVTLVMSGIGFGIIMWLRRFYHGPYDDNVDFVYVTIGCATAVFIILVCMRFKPVTRTFEWARSR